MDYKVLVNLFVPEIEKEFELLIPINKTVSEELLLINKLINNITNGLFPIKDNIVLYNRKTSQKYQYDILIRNTNIRNGTELVIE